MKSMVFSALAIVGLTASLVGAEMPLPGAEPLTPGTEGFVALDADKSGSISAKEAEALSSLSASFKTHDENGDGELSRAEYQAALSASIVGAEEEEAE